MPNRGGRLEARLRRYELRNCESRRSHVSDADSMPALRAEVQRLIALLDAHGIDWRGTQTADSAASAETEPSVVRLVAQETEPNGMSASEKVALFRDLFRGRTDVFPLRWESKTGGKSGYSAACANEWAPGICEKPRIKCSDCAHRRFLPMTDVVIYKHLAGKHTIGIYPLLPDDTTRFLAVDFDGAEWSADSLAFMQTCNALEVPAAHSSATRAAPHASCNSHRTTACFRTRTGCRRADSGT